MDEEIKAWAYRWGYYEINNAWFSPHDENGDYPYTFEEIKQKYNEETDSLNMLRPTLE